MTRELEQKAPAIPFFGAPGLSGAGPESCEELKARMVRTVRRSCYPVNISIIGFIPTFAETQGLLKWVAEQRIRKDPH